MNIWWMLLAVVYFNGALWAFADMTAHTRTMEYRLRSIGFILQHGRRTETFCTLVAMCIVTFFWPVHLYFVIKEV